MLYLWIMIILNAYDANNSQPQGAVITDQNYQIVGQKELSGEIQTRDTRFKPIQTFGLESMKAKLSFPLENPNLQSLLYILMVLLIYS